MERLRPLETAAENWRVNVPLWRTLSVLATIVLTASIGAYNFSTTMTGLQASLGELKATISSLVIELRSKVSADDLDKQRELDCMRFQQANASIGWKCPLTVTGPETSMIRRHTVPVKGAQ